MGSATPKQAPAVAGFEETRWPEPAGLLRRGWVRARERAGGRSVRGFPYHSWIRSIMSRHARRTTADLVAELHSTAARHDRAALVVGFDDRTEFVWANDPDALGALNGHVRNGGDPLGVVTGRSQ